MPKMSNDDAKCFIFMHNKEALLKFTSKSKKNRTFEFDSKNLNFFDIK